MNHKATDHRWRMLYGVHRMLTIKHPNSGYLFKGNEVVNYSIIKEQIIKIFNAISFLKFVALDVAITNDGFKIIETNSYPDPAVAQYKYGFKADPNFSILFK